MIVTRLTQRVLLVLVCCLAIISLPVAAGAQDIIKKGAEGVKKGVETGVDKTKEGAEAVGHGVKEGAESVGQGVKKAVTGEDTSTSRMKSTETEPTKPAQATTPSTRSQTVTPSERTTGEPRSSSRETENAATRGERLPGTAGELPLLALIGVLALAGYGTSKLIRRVRVMK
jgi:hypothetical protein